MYIAHQRFRFSGARQGSCPMSCAAIRRFVGIDFGRESAPDPTILLKIRRLLEKHLLTAIIFDQQQALSLTSV